MPLKSCEGELAECDVGSPPDSFVWADSADCGDNSATEYMSVRATRAAVMLAADAARSVAVAFAACDPRLTRSATGFSSQVVAAAAAAAAEAPSAALAPALAGGFRRARVAAAARRAVAAHAAAAAELAAAGASPADHVAALRSFIADLRAGARAALAGPDTDTAGTDPCTGPVLAARLAARLRSSANAAALALENIGAPDRHAIVSHIKQVHAQIIEIEALFDM